MQVEVLVHVIYCTLEGDKRVYEKFEGKGLQEEYDTKKLLEEELLLIIKGVIQNEEFVVVMRNENKVKEVDRKMALKDIEGEGI